MPGEHGEKTLQGRQSTVEPLAVMRSARGRVNHYARRDEMNVSLCGVELVGGPDDVTAWTLCAKCERAALLLPRTQRGADHAR
jgi:hypothetical protein